MAHLGEMERSEMSPPLRVGFAARVDIQADGARCAGHEPEQGNDGVPALAWPAAAAAAAPAERKEGLRGEPLAALMHVFDDRSPHSKAAQISLSYVIFIVQNIGFMRGAQSSAEGCMQ
jgi:hypothetical protein